MEGKGRTVVGMAASPIANGYWLIARDGGIFSFNVPYEGSAAGHGMTNAIGMALTS